MSKVTESQMMREMRVYLERFTKEYEELGRDLRNSLEENIEQVSRDRSILEEKMQGLLGEFQKMREENFYLKKALKDLEVSYRASQDLQKNMRKNYDHILKVITEQGIAHQR